jgi:enoyl-CoA hydratase/carnithine racemase
MPAPTHKWQISEVEGTNVVIVTMADPKNKMNILTDPFLDQCDECLDRLEKEYPNKAVVFTGNDRVFSAGLDLKRLFSLPPPKNIAHPLFTGVQAYPPYPQVKPSPELAAASASVIDHVDRIDKLGKRLFALPRPTVAAINGHAIAGGTFLACACDYRVAADTKGMIGLNEVPNGFLIPYNFMVICAWACRSASKAMQWFCSGKLATLQEACAMGVVDEVVKNTPCKDKLDMSNCGCGKHKSENLNGSQGWSWGPLGDVVKLEDLSPLLQRSVEIVNHKAKSVPSYAITKAVYKRAPMQEMDSRPLANKGGLKMYYGSPVTEEEWKQGRSVGVTSKL